MEVTKSNVSPSKTPISPSALLTVALSFLLQRWLLVYLSVSQHLFDGGFQIPIVVGFTGFVKFPRPPSPLPGVGVVGTSGVRSSEVVTALSRHSLRQRSAIGPHV